MTATPGTLRRNCLFPALLLLFYTPCPKKTTWRGTLGRNGLQNAGVSGPDLGEESGTTVTTCSKHTAGESGECGSSLLCFSRLFIYIHIYMRKQAVFLSSKCEFDNFLCILPEVTADIPMTHSQIGWLLESKWEFSRVGWEVGDRRGREKRTRFLIHLCHLHM